MRTNPLSRRQFLQRSLVASGALALGSRGLVSAGYAAVTRRTAADQVTLGNTGIKLSRLGFGTAAPAATSSATSAGKDSTA